MVVIDLPLYEWFVVLLLTTHRSGSDRYDIPPENFSKNFWATSGPVSAVVKGMTIMSSTTAVDSGGRVTTRVEFDEFVAARSSGLLRTAYLLTRDHALAEDLLQTALAKAWFSWKRVAGNPEPYVRKILVNTYASWWRRKWNGEHAHDVLPDRGTPDRSDHVSGAHDLWQAMDRLPRKQRAVIVLRYFEDLTEAETARLLECSVGTVKSQASKALAKLRIDPALATEEGELA